MAEAAPAPVRLTRTEAAEYLGLQYATLATWASEGRYDLPFIKCGRRVYYLRGDLDGWMQSPRMTRTRTIKASKTQKPRQRKVAAR